MAEHIEKRILLIDGLNTFYRSYAVDPSLNLQGEHVGGTKGFLKQLQKFCREVNPHKIIVAWDGPGGSKRRKSMSKTYKEGRSPVTHYNRAHDQHFSNEEEEKNKIRQLSRLFEYLNLMPVSQILIDGVEADDIIAECCRLEELKDYFKIIISNDKDFLQLLDDKTINYRPATKRYVSIFEMMEQYSIHPYNMALVRAVAGDKSDNLDGVPGVGIKTVVNRFPLVSGSAKLTIQQFYDEVEASHEENPLKTFSSILENRHKVELNYKMMQLYAPQLSPEASQKIRDMVDAKPDVFNWFELQKMMIRDGYEDHSWKEMEQVFNRIMRDASEV